MDPVTGSLIGGAAGNLGGSVLGSVFGSKDRSRARKALEAALNDISGSRPEMEQTAFDTIYSDPRLRAAQLDALSGFQDEANAGGMSIQSRAALNQANAQQAAQERGSREALLQNMARRGMGGSGTELAAALQNQQASADRGAMAGTQAAADARNRALSAMAQTGELAGGIRGQDFGEGAAKAQARDARNRFNATQRLQAAGMKANVRTNQASNYNNQANRWEQMGAGLGGGAGSLAGFFGSGGKLGAGGKP